MSREGWNTKVHRPEPKLRASPTDRPEDHAWDGGAQRDEVAALPSSPLHLPSVASRGEVAPYAGVLTEGRHMAGEGQFDAQRQILGEVSAHVRSVAQVSA